MWVESEHNYKGTSHQVFYDSSSYEILHVNSPVFYKNDFLNPVIDETNDVATAEEGTGNAVAASVATNGWAQIDTGTVADKRNVIAGELVYEAENELIFQCKLKTTTSDAGILLFAGLNDSKDEGTGKLPIKDGSHASGSIDAWADDCVGFGVRAETSDNVYAVSCKAAGTPQTTDTTTDLTLATDYILEIVLDSSGNAGYYLNGASVATHTSAITATDPLTWFVGALITTGSTAAFVDIDYVLCAQNRA
jgi:hypothetical protein